MASNQRKQTRCQDCDFDTEPGEVFLCEYHLSHDENPRRLKKVA